MTRFDNLISGTIMFPRNPYKDTHNERFFRNEYMSKTLRIEAHPYLNHTFKCSTTGGTELGMFSQHFLETWAILDLSSAKYNTSKKKKSIEWEGGV